MTDKTVPFSSNSYSRPARVAAAASVNNTLVQGQPSVVDGVSFTNFAAYDVFVKFYDKATAPVAGTDTPYMVVRVQAGKDRDIPFPKGVKFASGLGYAITKLLADSDTTVVVANDLIGKIFYR